jgi:general stress protein 26
MPTTDPAKPLDDLMRSGTIVMLLTMVDDVHASRPLTVAGVHGRRIEFLIDRTTDWAQAIADGSAVVHASVADVRSNTYLSLNGTASITADDADIERLWSTPAGAFFDGKDDPGLAVLRLDVGDGEYWDSPSGRLGSALAMVKAAVTGNADAAGDHGPVAAV